MSREKYTAERIDSLSKKITSKLAVIVAVMFLFPWKALQEIRWKPLHTRMFF